MFQTYYQYEKIEGVERKQIDKIPEKAFREAIANALVPSGMGCPGFHKNQYV